ncbi:MAG: FAD-dependent oxidoreductase, partial [Phycisphaerae bacterium]
LAPNQQRAEPSLREDDGILANGGNDLQLNPSIGEQIARADLESTFDAVFVGAGLGADSALNIPGESLPGVVGAVQWIEHIKRAKATLDGVSRCVVVGGGNTAIDAVRQAIGLGIPRVTMLYRGSEAGMSGYQHEWDAAKQHGAIGEWKALPVAFEGSGPSDTSRVQRIRCQRLDDAKKPIANSDFTVDADLVLVAIGQSKLGQMLGSLSGITID